MAFLNEDIGAKNSYSRPGYYGPKKVPPRSEWFFKQFTNKINMLEPNATSKIHPRGNMEKMYGKLRYKLYLFSCKCIQW